MVWRFWTGTEGLIWVDPGEGRGNLQETLHDSISSLSPRSAPPGLSTYWIDRALRRLESDKPAEETIVISEGNATGIVKRGDQVIAISLYDAFEDEPIDPAELQRGLADWRGGVEAAIQEGRKVDSDQHNYQRNPDPR